MSVYKIFVVSDTLNLRAAESIAFQAASQFSDFQCKLVKVPNVTTLEKVNEVMEQAKEAQPCLVIFATVLVEVRNAFTLASLKHRVECIDVLSPAIKTLGNILKTPPVFKQKNSFDLGQDYYDKIEAIEFAINNDDGRSYQSLKKADVVLIGVSRTSKTPLSIYLAYHNYLVVNIPLVKEVEVPEGLFKISPRKIIGLTIASERLNEIRTTRDSSMGVIGSSDYSDMNKIIEELSFADDLMKRIGCKVVNVSNRAIEETAEIIMTHLKKSRKK